MQKTILQVFILVVLLSALALSANAQSQSFTYQGSLKSGATAASGTYDFRFDIYSQPAGSTPLATNIINAVQVTNGIFTVQLAFPSAVFPDGAGRFLEISVKASGGATYEILTPRQPFTSVPYAVRSETALSATTATVAVNAQQADVANTALFASQVTGVVQIPNGGTGSTNTADARTNLGLGSLSTVTPTGTADNKTFLRGDNKWTEPPLNFNVMLSRPSFSGTGTTSYFYPSGTPTASLSSSQFTALPLPRACTLGDFKVTVPDLFTTRTFQLRYASTPSSAGSGTVAASLTVENFTGGTFSTTSPATVNLPENTYVTIVESITGFTSGTSTLIPFHISFTCR